MSICLLSQENQDYYNRYDQQLIARKHDSGQKYYNKSDQQFITRKHNGGLKQVTIELVPNIILEEEGEKEEGEEDNFINGLTSMISGIIPLHICGRKSDGVPTHLMSTTMFSILPKPNITRNQRQEFK